MDFATTQARPAIPAEVVDRVIENLRTLIDEYVCRLPTNGVELMDLERGLHQAVARQVVDPIVAEVVRSAHESNEVRVAAALVRKSVPYMRSQDKRQTVNIVLLGGSSVEIVSPYYLQRPPRDPGRPRGRGKRGKSGHGMYPFLEVLGLTHRVTPAVAGEVARLVALGTVDEAREALGLRGLFMDRKHITRVYREVAIRGLQYRDWLQAKAETHLLKAKRLADGQRLVIGLDGGRLRTRKTRRGRRRNSGRRGFDAPWREPKVLVVYTIDATGRRAEDGHRLYEATLRDADALFGILQAVLVSIGSQRAAEWIVVGDGAGWLWNRIDELVDSVGYKRSLVTEVVDFYHALQHLHKMADSCNWTKSRHEKWVKKVSKLLKEGNVDAVLAEGNELCVGRRAKTIRTELAYFEAHRLRMRYDVFRRRKIPCGSGAVESAIRRIVNLRLKGNGIFWTETNAEAVLHLRAQLLSGQWDRFMHKVLRPACCWASDLAVMA